MKVYILAAIVAMSCLFSSSARSEEFNGFQKGDWALSLNGGGAADKDLDNGAFTLNVTVSHYLTNSFELGVNQSASYNDGFTGLTGGFVNYNFRLEDPKFVPFVGANVGYSYGEDVSDAWRAGPQVGLKYFVNTTTYVYGQVAYEFDLNDGFDNGGFVYGVGLGFRF